MIMSRLLLFVSLILLWTKEVKAVRPHYTIRYRESTERESNMATATERRGFSSTAKGRSLEDERSREYIERCSSSGKTGKRKSGKGGKTRGRRFLQFPCDDFSMPSDDGTDDLPPSGAPSDAPSGAPSGAPSDAPSGAPSDAPGDDVEISNDAPDDTDEEISNDVADVAEEVSVEVFEVIIEEENVEVIIENLVTDRSQFQGGDAIVGLPTGGDDGMDENDDSLTNEDFDPLSNDGN